ncbi:metal-dependent hydrolase [Paenibacillus sp. 11B]|uniref:metal-dependent hydrolase n=1 Tax=Paenibacillus sp. 11B TaxID=3060965 RepID=UPI002655CE3F|nr:metal-dependent hydrolase [Paenibacillus sp. 11B]MDN8593160.1 metal-dependent hydrolase [Paenibacillus sp. 11B]
MMGRSHFVISTGLTLSALAILNQPITIPAILITGISALLPDIDEPNSLIVSRTLPKGLIRLLQLLLIATGAVVFFSGVMPWPWNIGIAIAIGLFSFLPLRTLRNMCMVGIGTSLIVVGQGIAPWNYIIGALLVVCVFLPHRGLTHTIYGLGIWAAILYFASHEISSAIWIGGSLSYALHLLADSLTNRGIRPLPPFKYRLKFNLMSTGSRWGGVVEGACIGLTVIILVITFYTGRFQIYW